MAVTVITNHVKICHVHLSGLVAFGGGGASGMGIGAIRMAGCDMRFWRRISEASFHVGQAEGYASMTEWKNRTITVSSEMQESVPTEGVCDR